MRISLALMNYIVDRIWLGSEAAASDLNSLEKNGISTVIAVISSDRISNFYPVHWRFLFLHQYDGDPIPQESFDKAIRMIKISQEEGRNILVHCMMGVSRSPSVVAAYLMKKKELNPLEALMFLSNKRPQVFPAGECFRSAVDFSFPDEKWICNACNRQWIYGATKRRWPNFCECKVPKIAFNSKSKDPN